MSERKELVNPFVGLRAFEEHEDYLFFGRSKQINELLKKFNSSRFLAVIGSSGSGKSSLVMSGLLPAIYSGFMTVGKSWHVALFKPGNDPIGNLARELATDGVLYDNATKSDFPYEVIIENTLRRSSNGLINAFSHAHLPPTENLLVVIDQFEELFRFSRYEKDNITEGKSDALNFVNLLLTAAQQKEVPVYVVITMRSDFLGDCALFRGLPEAINDGQYLVPRMIRDEIREAITGPVAVSTAKIAPRLVTRILNDIGNNLDQLPILQHALMRTWDEWYKSKNHSRPIDIEDYEKIGGWSDALSLHADLAYSELDKKQELICELMFKALTDSRADARGTRRPTSIRELADITGATEQQVKEVVEVFRKPGRTFLLLNSQSIVDISHESLMRNWKRLIKWNEEEAMNAEIYLRLSEDMMRNEASKADLYLLRKADLEIGLKWYRNNKPNAVWAKRYNSVFEKVIAFLLKSEAADIEEKKQKEKIRKRIRVLIATIIVGLIVASVIFLSLWNKAEEATAIAKEAQKRDSASFIRAERNYQEAMKQTQIANEAKYQDSLSTIAALASAFTADSARIIADQKKKEAFEANKELVSKNKELEASKESILKQNRAIALNEYLRLITKGPNDEARISREKFDYKLIAYDQHINILDTSNEHSWNNDFYTKLYHCLEAHKKTDAVISNFKDPFPDNNDLGNSIKVKFENERLIITDTKNNLEKSSVAVSGTNRIECIQTDKNNRKIFCSTSDYKISVFNYSDDFQLTPDIVIPLGALVTAIDYDASRSVIYFGMKSGDIGFIQLKKDKKNQPVYENLFESKITAVDFFNYKGNNYFLVTSDNGHAELFRLDNNDLVPNKKLQGIELPVKMGSVKNAVFVNGRILLNINNIAYSWNPFPDEIKAELKSVLNAGELSNTIKATMFYK